MVGNGAHAADTIRFADFEVDSRTGELRRGDARTLLQDQPLRILVRLLERPGALVTREELRRELWATDTFVDFEHGLNAAIKRLRAALGDSAEAPRFIETLPRRGYRFIAPITKTASPSEPCATSVLGVQPWQKRFLVSTVSIALAGVALFVWGIAFRQGSRAASFQSIAILPFANLTGDPRQEYFVTGVTEAVGAELARTPGLRVISGTSAGRYSHTTKSARQIALELGGVDGLVEGLVMRDGGRVRVTADLVDARTDTRLWTGSCDRDVTDILTLYSDISRSIAVEVGGATAISAPSPTGGRAVSASAYDAYLQGAYYRRRWQAGGCLTAVPYLEQAIAIDPTLAEAYADLAYCYAYPDRMRRPGWETAPKAAAAVERALALDSRLGFAHAMFAQIKLRYEYDWRTAEREAAVAIELAPASSQSYFAYGELLYASGRLEEGFAALRKGMDGDPLNLDNQTAYGYALRSARRYAEAIEQFKRTLNHQPDWTVAKYLLSLAYGDARRRDDAVASYLDYLRDIVEPRRIAEVTGALRSTYAESGWEAFWSRELEFAATEVQKPGTVLREPNTIYSGPFRMALRYALVGDRDGTIAWLERAYAYRHHLMIFIDCEPLFDDIRTDPRFQDLRRRVGLTGASHRGSS